MDNDFVKVIEDIFDVEHDISYEFRKLHGFTFVFKIHITTMGKSVTSAEIAPSAIIYENKGEFYLAPLDENIKKEDIIKDFAEKCL